MNIALWVIAGILAFAFAGAGVMKLTTSRADLLPKMPWVADATDAQVRGVGAVELLGAIGLILPPLLGIAPVLAPLAAVGLAATMVGAVIVHLRRGDGIGDAVPAIVLGALAVFVAVMRFGSESF